jgi:transcriptional regulator with XRE-family HTH domain
MAPYSKNLVTGRQLRAARVLAGLTQRTLGAALGVDERAVRFWERKHDRRPTGVASPHEVIRSLC